MSHLPVLVLFNGDIGLATAKAYQRLNPGCRIEVIDSNPGALLDIDSDLGAIALISPVPLASVSNLIDDVCFSHGITFVPLTFSSLRWRIAPVVVPGHSPCWRCGTAYALALAAHQPTYREFLRFYDRHPNGGPIGYLPSLARLGASLLNQTVKDADRERFLVGKCLEVDAIKGDFVTEIAVKTTPCDRCGRELDLEKKAMEAALQAMWGGTE